MTTKKEKAPEKVLEKIIAQPGVDPRKEETSPLDYFTCFILGCVVGIILVALLLPKILLSQG